MNRPCRPVAEAWVVEWTSKISSPAARRGFFITMTQYPLTTLLKDWADLIENLVKELSTLSDSGKKRTMFLILRRVRMALIAFYSPVKCKWWDNKKIELTTHEGKFEAEIFDEDFGMYQTSITRMLATDVWWIIEAHYRKGAKGNIRNILINKLGSIPPAINTLRLMKNCFHSEGIHSSGGADSTFSHKTKNFKFVFTQGKPIKNYSLPCIIELIQEVIVEIINS